MFDSPLGWCEACNAWRALDEECSRLGNADCPLSPARTVVRDGVAKADNCRVLELPHQDTTRDSAQESAMANAVLQAWIDRPRNRDK